MKEQMKIRKKKQNKIMGDRKNNQTNYKQILILQKEIKY